MFIAFHGLVCDVLWFSSLFVLHCFHWFPCVFHFGILDFQFGLSSSIFNLDFEFGNFASEFCLICDGVGPFR